jgi:hypothetical protein
LILRLCSLSSPPKATCPPAATLDELLSRFGHGSDQRLAQADSLRWLLPLCQRAGIARLLVNGSFVTSRHEPNDVDCICLQGPAYDPASQAAYELRQGLPFLEIKVVNQGDFDFFAETLFASDRKMVPKGIVEVLLWT